MFYYDKHLLHIEDQMICDKQSEFKGKIMGRIFKIKDKTNKGTQTIKKFNFEIYLISEFGCRMKMKWTTGKCEVKINSKDKMNFISDIFICT